MQHKITKIIIVINRMHQHILRCRQKDCSKMRDRQLKQVIITNSYYFEPENVPDSHTISILGLALYNPEIPRLKNGPRLQSLCYGGREVT